MAGADNTDFGQDRAAVGVLAKLRDGRWRQARDEAKKLWKKDRARYLPLLLEANVGLVREMIGKGRTKDAETVVAYLETIAPPELVAKLKVEMSSGALPQGKGKGKGKGKGSGDAEWLVALACAGRIREGKEISKENWAAIDRLVAGFFSPPLGEPGKDGEAQLAAELELVRKACNATGEGNWEEAREALRKVPGDSPFKHWRMFLRGVRCFFEEELETARRCFEGLPDGGGLALAAKSFGPSASSSRGPSAPPEAEVPFLLAATGQPAFWAGSLVTAIAAWRKGLRLKAFEGLLKGLKKAFPTQQPGLASALTDAILPWGSHMNERDYDFGDDLSLFLGRRGNTKKFGKSGALSCFRPMLLDAGKGGNSSDIEASGQALVDFWKEAEGSDPVRDGAILHWAGKAILAVARQPRSWLDSRPESGDLKIARQVLERSVKLYPENEDAWLTLLEAVSAQKDKKSHNRILGEASKKFPRSKGILKLAGEEAFRRRTYVKSLKLLEAARDLDPLDKELKSLIMAALLEQTREYLNKGREVSEQWKSMALLLEARAASGDLMLTPWIWQVRRSLLDSDPESAARAFAEAERLAPSRSELLLICFAFRDAYQLHPDKNWKKEWRKTLAGEPLGWEAITSLFPLIVHLSEFKGWGAAKYLRFREVLKELLDQSMEAAMADDPDGLMNFVEYGLKMEDPGMDSHAIYLFRFVQDHLLGCLELAVETGQGRAGNADLRVRYAYLRLMEKTEAFLTSPVDDFQDHLNSVESDAATAGMGELLARVKAIRSRLGDKYQGFNNPMDDVYDEEEDWEDEGPGDEEIGAALTEYVEALKSGDGAAEARALAVFERAGIPEKELRKGLEERGLLPPLPPKPRPKPKPKKPQKKAKPLVDDQPDFFDLFDQQ